MNEALDNPEYFGWRSGVRQDFVGGGVRFCLVRPSQDDMIVMSDLSPNAGWTQHVQDRNAAIEHWFQLEEGAARALLDALSAHFGGSGDVRLARQDLVSERKRVDQLTTALITIATKEPS